MGNATGIIIGNLLGKGENKEAKQASYRILGFALVISLSFALLMVASSFIIPNIYDTSDNIREIAKTLIIVGAIFVPVQAFNTCCYFMLRAGGKVLLTIVFDSLYVWIVRLPLAFILANFTSLSVVWLYFLINMTDVIKIFIGYYLVDKGIWLKKLE